jgi:predicted ferric reductase
MTKYIPLIRRNKLVISNVKVYPMKIIKIQFKGTERQLAGKTVYIGKGRFPIEWHPYTFVDDTFLIMKVRGDWTTALARSLGVLFEGKSSEMVTPTSYSNLIYDGGFKNIKMESTNSVYIATGIGITTFVHHIRTSDLRSSVMIIVVKTLKELIWLWETDAKRVQRNKLSMVLFITGKNEWFNRMLVDDLPDNVEQISFRRPDWRETLQSLENRGVRRVYYAGVGGVNLRQFTKMPVTEV